MDVPRLTEPPALWRLKPLPTDTPEDRFYTNEGCRFSPHYFTYDRGNEATEYVVDSCATDKLQLFVLPFGHPAFPGMGVKAREALPQGTEIGYYTGIIMPNWFLEQDDNNAYVMVASPKPYNLVINSKRVGNITRFINDPRGTGCEASVKSEWVSKGRDPYKFYFVLMSAKRDIAAGEELLLNYEAGNSDYWKAMAKQHQRTCKIIDLTIDEVPVKRERQEEKEDIKTVSTPKRSKQQPENVFTSFKRILWCDLPGRQPDCPQNDIKYFPVTYTYEHPAKGKCRVIFTPILRAGKNGEWRYYASLEHLDKHEIEYHSYMILEKNHPAWNLLLQNGHTINEKDSIYIVPYSAIAFGSSKWVDVTKDHISGD